MKQTPVLGRAAYPARRTTPETTSHSDQAM